MPLDGAGHVYPASDTFVNEVRIYDLCYCVSVGFFCTCTFPAFCKYSSELTIITLRAQNRNRSHIFEKKCVNLLVQTFNFHCFFKVDSEEVESSTKSAKSRHGDEKRSSDSAESRIMYDLVAADGGFSGSGCDITALWRKVFDAVSHTR